ncbi:MAG: AAA family ATPase [Lentisphaeria bacterium]|nr:AAA family ATPase [Lentisphaeria bacterium]
MNHEKLNPEQTVALEKIKQGGNYIIVGNAGTGKSTLLRHLRDAIPDAVYAAPTGAAARLIGGATLNSLLRIPPHPYITEESMDVLSSKSARKAIAAIKTLVIDEVSLVRADVFAAIDYRLRQYGPERSRLLPFGGRQLILCGDFFQLPPVVSNDNIGGYSVGELLERDLGGIYAFNTPLWFQAKISPLYLRSNMRQAEDEEFQECLDAFRCGDVAKHQAAIDVLNSRVTANLPADAVYLCPRKSEVDAINDGELFKLKTETRCFTATKRGIYEKDFPVDWELRLKLRERVLITANMSGDVVNGTTGIISAFTNDAVIVELADGREIHIEPYEFKNISYRVVRDPETGEERPVPVEIGWFRQLPLRPAYALTIHKAQGMTLKSVVLDRGNRGCFAHGQCYAAISRVRRLEDLHLLQPLALDDVIVDPEVLLADRRLRDKRLLWAACVKDALTSLTPEEKDYVEALNDYAQSTFEKIIFEYQRRFNAGEETSEEFEPYFGYLSRELFLFYTERKKVNLLEIFSGLLRNL